MRYTLAAAALAAGASAHYNAYNQTTEAPVYTTEVVTAYTTYCPGATEVSHNGVTYTITEATTLTITNCPCTVTKPVYSSAVTYCSTCSASSVVYTTHEASSTPVYVATSPEAVSTSTPVATYPVESVASTAVVPSATPIVPGPPSSPIYNNATVPATGSAPAGTGAATATTPASFTGAANKMAASGASLAGLLGLAAFLL